MRIGIDVLSVSETRSTTGLFQYVDQLTRHLPADPGVRYTLYCRRGDAGWAGRMFPGRRVRGVPSWPRVWRAWAAFNRSDVFLHNLQSAVGPVGRGANVYCVPDVIPLAVPGCVPADAVPPYRAYYEEAVRHGDAIVCWAEHTRRDLLARVGGEPARVHVVPLAAGPGFAPAPPEAVRAARARHGLAGAPYVLCVSTVEVRKNHAALLRAFARLVARDPALPHHLVFSGAKWVGADDALGLVGELGLGDRFHYLGYADDLPALYTGADAFAFPSRYEGFGLPPLEAMACGAPVVCADASSLPEVVGDAALLFDPDDDAALAGHLRRLLTDPAARADYSARGLRRAAEFSWARTAAGYLGVMRAARAGRARRPEAATA